MLNPFFFQNHLTGRPPGTVVINFLGTTANFQLVYKKGSTYVEAKPKDVLRASTIVLNYAYLGGEHFCNYTLTRQGNTLKFSLNKAMLYSGDYAPDINKAVFYADGLGDACISPVQDIEFYVDDNNIEITKLTTFHKVAYESGVTMPVTFETDIPYTPPSSDPTVIGSMSYLTSSGVQAVCRPGNIRSDLLKDGPQMQGWKLLHQDIVELPLAFTYFAAPLSGTGMGAIVELICRYDHSFDINNPSTIAAAGNELWIKASDDVNTYGVYHETLHLYNGVAGPLNKTEYRNFVP